MHMGKSSAKHELILLYDKLGFEPKKMMAWLRERGQNYSYHTLKDYYSHYSLAKMVAQGIMQKTPIKLRGEDNGS